MKYFTGICLLVCSFVVQAGDSKVYVQKLLNSIESGNYHDTFAKAMVATYKDVGKRISLSEAREKIGPLMSSFQEFHEIAGQYNGYELLVSKSLGSKYKREKYILYYDTGIFMLNLELYAPRGKWGVRKYKFSSKIDDYFSEYVDSVYE